MAEPVPFSKAAAKPGVAQEKEDLLEDGYGRTAKGSGDLQPVGTG